MTWGELLAWMIIGIGAAGAVLIGRDAMAADAIVTWQTGPQPAGITVTSALVQWNNCTSSWASVTQSGSTQILVAGLPVGTNCFRVQNIGSDGTLSDPSPTVSAVIVDTDLDGISNMRDDCTAVANPTQLDADNDGYGNICDGDLDQSGVVTSNDYTLMQSVMLQHSNYSPLAAAADMNGSGQVTSADYTLLKNQLLKPPGPSGLHP